MSPDLSLPRSRAARLLLVLGFLAICGGAFLWQFASRTPARAAFRELAAASQRALHAAGPRTANAVLLDALQSTEHRLEEVSPLRSLLPAVQWLTTALLRAGNQQVAVGRAGWLFYQPELDHLLAPGFLEPEVLRRRRGAKDVEPDPRPALRGLADDLRARGIGLLVLPVPVKPAIHPERFAAGARPPLENPSYSALLQQLEAAGIQVFDPTPLLVDAARSAGEPQYLSRDTHWTPAAMERVATALGDRLTALGLPALSVSERWVRGERRTSGAGDLVELLELPRGQTDFPPETVTIHPVAAEDGSPWRPDPRADLLLLGDSFTNVYSQAGLGWGDGAGLAEQLSFHLGRAVDRLAVNAGGAAEARRRLLAALADDPQRLDGKRWLVYQFSARELSLGDWPVLPLPSAEAEDATVDAVPAPVLDSAPPAATPALEPGALPEGFAVWESNRTGDWRIWTSRLDGSGLRQLSSEERGRQHFCPHISPDGRLVAYLSRTDGKDSYPEPEVPGELRLLTTDGSAERTLTDAARTYSWGNRCAVWKSPSELIHLDGEGRTVLRDVVSGRTTPLTTAPRRELGYLVDSTLRHASSGEPSFAAYDAERRQVIARQPLPGCEPYFTGGGRWGFWSAGGGGPILRMRLADREVSMLLSRDDPRLPAGRRYVYFSMISHDGRLFAYGASAGEHDHFHADYDIFVAPLHPLRLELRGRPVRLTEHPATDRYPDVWAAPLALGLHAGEAPYTVRLGDSQSDAVGWSFGDGTRGDDGTHTYRRAGEYEVTAQAGARRLDGMVYVEPAAAPRVLSAVAEDGTGDVVVAFDEAVALERASVRRLAGQPLAWRPGGDERSLRVAGRERLAAGDRLLVSGVADRAQQPNPMPPATIVVEPPPWPSDRTDLAFAWQSAAESTPAFDLGARLVRAFTVEPRGRARFDRGRAMDLPGDSWFEAEPAAGENIAAAVRRGRALSLEVTLTPSLASTPALTPLLALGERPGERSLLLAQEGDQLVFWLLSGPREQAAPPLRLFALAAGRTEHVVVTYAPPSDLAVFRNGERVAQQAKLAGGFARWQPRPLTFGRAGSDGPAWRGTLEGIALWGRRLSAEEAARNFSLMRQHRSTRGAPPAAIAVLARLRACSRTPTLAEISPYRQALIVCAWTPQGEAPASLAKELRVAHWAILDRELQAIATLSPGAVERLRLEPFADHPELEPHVLADTLDTRAGALYYALER